MDVQPISSKKLGVLWERMLFDAVLSFVFSRNPLKAINSVASTLVPKLQNVNRVADFGPVSCCSTICKCISKILANRLRFACLL